MDTAKGLEQILGYVFNLIHNENFVININQQREAR